MPEEGKEELKQQGELTPASDAPTGDGDNKVADESSISREQESEAEDVGGKQQNASDQLREINTKLEKLAEERDNYKTAFLNLKSKSRMAELAGEEEIVTPKNQNETYTANNSVINDYSSKRADILAEFENKIQNLNDDEFKALAKRLRVEEQLLIQDAVAKNSFVAKKHVQQMVEENIDYINKRYHPEVEIKTTDTTFADIGSTKTNRKLSGKEPMSEEIHDIARESGLTPERVKELKQKGLI